MQTFRLKLARLAAVLGMFLVSPGNLASAWEPVRTHPQNPYILEFRGQPTLLRTWASTYEWVFDSTLPYLPYLDVLQRDGMNLTRVWCLGYPSYYPERLIQPWPRSTTGANGLDGLKKFDFSAWDEAYFDRLKAFVQAASDRGIVVEVTFFSVFYDNDEWMRSPFHPSNNVQGYGPNNRYDTMRPVNANLLAVQQAAVRRIVNELNGFDNIYYEIQNEPFWNQPGIKDDQEVAFHNGMLGIIRDEESTLPNQHLTAHNFPQMLATISSDFDVINEHYPAAVPGSTIAGAEALLSNHYSRGKILALDETNNATVAQVRLESWMFLIGGGGIYNGLDVDWAAYSDEDHSGDNAFGNAMRQAVRNIGSYMDQLHLVALRRNLAWVTGGIPTGATLQASASPDQQYVAYLHHGKSGLQNFQLHYDPIDASDHDVSLSVTLNEGSWRAVWTRPSDLMVLHVQEFIHGGGPVTLEPVTYQEDVALRIDRTGPGDITPPPPPSGLGAEANADGSVTLSWTPVLAPDLAGYHVYRSESPGVPIDAGHRIGIAAQTDTGYTDFTPVPSTTYYYLVTAVDDVGNSLEASSEVSATPILPYLLTTSSGNGSVSESGFHEMGSTASVTATPDPGCVFTGWSGDATGTDNPLAVLMDADKAIAGSFTPDTSDVDEDGLSAFLEITVYGTNPALADTDEDEVPDGEDAFPIDPLETVDTDGDGTGDNADLDDDEDGVTDSEDTFPLDPMESVDTDGDGIGNNADLDDDEDGVADAEDVFPLDPLETVDTDGDGTGDNADLDDDEDGVVDGEDVFPLDPLETVDTDGDGAGDNADLDDDEDGVVDADDAFPLDPLETLDTDGDGTGDNADLDDDEDGVVDTDDAFPLDSLESVDTDSDGTGDNADLDDDGDGVVDGDDAFPLDPLEAVDTDGDGTGDNADLDDDEDGVADEEDAFPLDPLETVDTDSDGTGDNADLDDDEDGVADVDDAFPLDPLESVDTDGDGIGDNADLDDDEDGVADVDDAFPLDPLEAVDTDGDGTGDNADLDDDEDGVADEEDAFPLDPLETVDTDGDGTGDNADLDDDEDGVADTDDAFPSDPLESVDTDGDGTGDNADLDDDEDGVADAEDAFPLDPLESVDTDGDGAGNNADLDDDEDGVADAEDAFPLDPLESVDTDGDGTGDNADLDDDEDGVADEDDAFPLDPLESVDTDGDGTGDNADLDDDEDGVADAEDAFPLDPLESVDTDGDGTGDFSDLDDDGDGVADTDDGFPMDPAESADTDLDGLGDNADPDDDNDGLSDAEEAGIGSNPLVRDSDGDGFEDLFEVTTGFDPMSGASVPDAVSSIRTAVEFRFNAANGVSYRIECSSDLSEWETVETDIIGEGAVVTRFYSIESQPKRYFRVTRN